MTVDLISSLDNSLANSILPLNDLISKELEMVLIMDLFDKN